jgi:hypothetical protein
MEGSSRVLFLLLAAEAEENHEKFRMIGVGARGLKPRRL